MNSTGAIPASTVQKARPRKTVDDFMSLPEGTRAELIDGELFMSPSPRRIHQRAAFTLATLLDRFVSEHDLGEINVAPLDVHLPSGDIVQPDIVFVANANDSILQDWVRGTPDLVVEALSPDGLERDRFVKRDIYAKNGVREYWIVDPVARTIEVFSLRGPLYEANGYFEGNDVLVSPMLAGLQIRLATVFAERRGARPR